MAVVEPHCQKEETEENEKRRGEGGEIGTVRRATGQAPVADRPPDLWRQYLPPERRENAASLASYVSGLNVILRRWSHVSLTKATTGTIRLLIPVPVSVPVPVSRIRVCVYVFMMKTTDWSRGNWYFIEMFVRRNECKILSPLKMYRAEIYIPHDTSLLFTFYLFLTGRAYERRAV